MSQQPTRALIHQPPTRPTLTRPSIILYGAIQPSSPSLPSWQSQLSTSLSDLPISILNPVRSDWDSTWLEDISFAPFHDQVRWEMDYAAIADVIVFNFVAGQQCPVTLLEMGLYAGSGKAVVCCPVGFWKRGNVQMVCERFRIPLVEGLEEVEREVRRRLEGKLGK